MTRVFVFVAAVLLSAAAAGATTMKPTAPEKMTSPADKQKMRVCQQRAAAQHVPMADRSKFVTDCVAAESK